MELGNEDLKLKKNALQRCVLEPQVKNGLGSCAMAWCFSVYAGSNTPNSGKEMTIVLLVTQLCLVSV